MKVLIVSDTHGRHTGLDRVLEKEGKIDLFIHLGDIECGESYINSVVECEKHMVRVTMIFSRICRGKRKSI